MIINNERCIDIEENRLTPSFLTLILGTQSSTSWQITSPLWIDYYPILLTNRQTIW